MATGEKYMSVFMECEEYPCTSQEFTFISSENLSFTWSPSRGGNVPSYLVQKRISYVLKLKPLLIYESEINFKKRWKSDLSFSIFSEVVVFNIPDINV